MINPIEINNWFLENQKDKFKFAGVSEDGELFIETSGGYFFNQEEENEIVTKLKNKFSVVKKITFVVKPSLEQVQEMILELNKLIKDSSSVPPNLLDIEEF